MTTQYCAMPEKDPCQKQACEIQKCLQANRYIESKCEHVIREMQRCCATHSADKSVCCSGFKKEQVEDKTKNK
ncbi:cx9C motif-containing protein 4 isoform X2 [Polypterus senegalus]|uniref:cx9C motif-containing protein 4 isoform X2 n=1 Tax=Polypterus senegalus TaxID=55291 RepID=UPI0019662AE2|nr:cx9C motif-containing protein 4 isoform X2 [Polypterus senegalus]